jgi:hypothetical protein
MRWARHIACIGAVTNVYNILDGKSEETIWKEQA